MMEYIYYVLAFTAVFVLGMLAGCLLKAYVDRRRRIKEFDRNFEEFDRLILECEENFPTAECNTEDDGTYLVLSQKGQPAFKAKFASQLQVLEWIGRIETSLSDAIDAQSDDEEKR